MPPVSVVVITHYKGTLLKNVLDCLLPQLQSRDEILIIDDGGHDRPIVRDFKDSRLRWIYVPHQGYRLSLLTNIGIQLARHDWIVKLDGDVQPDDNLLTNYRQHLERGVLLAGRIDDEQADGSVQSDWRFNRRTKKLAESMKVGPRGEYPFGHHRVRSGNIGFCREDILAIGGFDTDFDGHWGAEDAWVGHAYMHSGRRVKHLWDAHGLHRYHPSDIRGDNRHNLNLLVSKSEEPADWPCSCPARTPIYPYLDSTCWSALTR